jgi:hypothetical protein
VKIRKTRKTKRPLKAQGHKASKARAVDLLQAPPVLQDSQAALLAVPAPRALFKIKTAAEALQASPALQIPAAEWDNQDSLVSQANQDVQVIPEAQATIVAEVKAVVTDSYQNKGVPH